MKTKDFLYWLLVAIGAATVVSGAVQVVAPGFILGMMSAEVDAAGRHFFGIVGMFMVLFGGALLHALLSATHHPVVLIWAGLQKFGATGAVGLAVLRGLLSPLALGVALFDLFSGFVIFWYWLTIRRAA